MPFYLGELKIEVHVSQGGELRIKLDIISDELSKMFPIDTTKKLFLSEEDYEEYVDDVLDKKERWIRENIPPGVYSTKLVLNDTNLEME